MNTFNFFYLIRKLYKILIFLLVLIVIGGCKEKQVQKIILKKLENTKQLTYILPSPQLKGSITVEEAIANRRSHRRYWNKQISSDQLSQILWSAYGITNLKYGLRTAPSAGLTFPLEIYILIGKVKDIEPGVYKYIPQEHKIIRTIDKDIRKELCAAALNQEMISDAPAVLFYSAIYSRCTQSYGSRGRERYVCMDLGHSAQNVYLQAEAMHLGTCAIGAFDDSIVKKTMQLTEEEEPMYIMPIGYYLSKPKWLK